MGIDKEKAVERLDAARHNIASWKQDVLTFDQRHEDDQIYKYAGFLYPEFAKLMGKGAAVGARALVEYVRVLPVVLSKKDG